MRAGHLPPIVWQRRWLPGAAEVDVAGSSTAGTVIGSFEHARHPFRISCVFPKLLFFPLSAFRRPTRSDTGF